MFTMFKAIVLFASYAIVRSDYAFSDEVALRAKDIVNSELDKADAAIKVIESGINAGIADVTQAVAASRILFFGQKIAYHDQITILHYCSITTKFYFGLLNNGSSNGLAFQKGQDANALNVDGFNVDSHGFPSTSVPSLGKTNYDCTTRNWVKAANYAHRRVWSSVYLYSFDSKPTISLGTPFYNAAGTYVGAAGANFNLTTVSIALRNAFNYEGSTRSVFIVDKYSGYLVATSIDTPTYAATSTPGKYTFILANASTNAAVSSITKDLTAQGWPTTSVLSNGYFARTLAVTSSNPGLNWYLVVLIKQDTYNPSTVPSVAPTSAPTAPSKKPTATPSGQPVTATPSMKPTAKPSVKPTAKPSAKPSVKPTRKPSRKPA
eukprot:gene7546-15461_t